MTISATASEQRQGVLVVGHGTHSALGREQFLHLSQHFARKLAPTPVEPAFLELQQPDIEAAVARLTKRGVRRLTVVPLLLFAAGHAKEDIPQLVQAALARSTEASPDMSAEVKQAGHLGCHPALVELSQRRFEHALADKSPILRDDSCLLLVGRGSHDENATAEMHEFGRLRQQIIGGMLTEVAFLAMARPLLSDQLETLAASGVRRVIVQPHLLFHGDLLSSIEAQVSVVRSRTERQEWVTVSALADPAGDGYEGGFGTEILAKIMLDRYCETAIRIARAGRDS